MAGSPKLLHDQACFHVSRFQLTLKHGLQNNIAMNSAMAHLNYSSHFSCLIWPQTRITSVSSYGKIDNTVQSLKSISCVLCRGTSEKN